MNNYYTLSEASNILGVCKETLRRWDRSGKLTASREPMGNYRIYKKEDVNALLSPFELDSNVYLNLVKPHKQYTVLELFAGAGGLAVGLEQASLKCIVLNEIDKGACKTLRLNRPH